MDRALVVVDDSERHRELLREAGELAGGAGAELVLMTVMSEEEYEEDIEAFESIAGVENIGFGSGQVMEVAENFAQEIADEELAGIDVEYDIVGAVVDEGEHADRIIQVAENRECDHVFVTGRRRSPTGKAIFGDTAQSVILNFDGRVTVQTA
ncbi:MAG: universal stress protein [Halobacteriales archaeon]